MDITIQQLKMLREFDRQGTIARSADVLGFTASAVSQQLSNIERTTGIAVLERIGRNVVLTDAGHELVHHAEVVLEQLDRARSAIEEVQGAVAGELHVGFVESVGATMLEPIMRKLRNRHPEVRLRTAAIDGEPAEDLIMRGELNVSFTASQPGAQDSSAAGFDRLRVCRDWFRFVGPTSMFDGVPPRSIDLRTIEEHDFVGPPDQDICGIALRAIFDDADIAPFVAHRTPDYPTTLRLVAAEAGVALVPDLGLTHVPPGVTIVDLDRPHFRSLDLVVRSSSAQRPAINAFVAIVREVANELGLDCDDGHLSLAS